MLSYYKYWYFFFC